jgi:hypothetical protein
MNTDTTKDGTIIEFLLGSHSFEGVWFDEKQPSHVGNFWWREPLRKFLASKKEQPVSSSIEDAAEEYADEQYSTYGFVNEEIKDLIYSAVIHGSKLIASTPAQPIPDEQDESYPGSQYQRLFNWLRDKNFIALQSEMQEVIDIVKKDF